MATANLSVFLNSHTSLSDGKIRLTSIPEKVKDQLVLETVSRHMKDKEVISSQKSWVTNLLTFCDEMTGSLDEGRTVDTVYVIFSKAVGVFFHKSLIERILKYGLHEQRVSCTEDWPNGLAQKVMISGMKSSWRLVIRGVIRGPLLGPALFSIFFSDLDEGTGCTFSKFADTKLLSQMVVLPPSGTFTGWRNELRKNLMKFSRESAKSSPGKEQPSAGDHPAGKQPSRKGLGVLVDTKLITSQQCVLMAKR